MPKDYVRSKEKTMIATKVSWRIQPPKAKILHMADSITLNSKTYNLVRFNPSMEQAFIKNEQHQSGRAILPILGESLTVPCRITGSTETFTHILVTDDNRETYGIWCPKNNVYPDVS